MGMGLPGCLEAGKRLGPPRHDPPGREVDVEVDQFLARRHCAIPSPEQLVRDVQALGIDVEHNGPSLGLVALVQFRDVQCVRLNRERPASCCGQVCCPEPDSIPQHIGGGIDQHDVVGEVQMAIMVDPLGTNRSWSAGKRGR